MAWEEAKTGRCGISEESVEVIITSNTKSVN